MLHEDLTGRIIGAAMTVHSKLRPGLDEKLYERALVLQFAKEGIPIQKQKSFPVLYDDELIGSLVPDLIVDNRVIADSKVVSDFHESHVSQMLGYLNITGLQVGLLINFKHARLDWKRIVL